MAPTSVVSSSTRPRKPAAGRGVLLGLALAALSVGLYLAVAARLGPVSAPTSLEPLRILAIVGVALACGLGVWAADRPKRVRRHELAAGLVASSSA